MVRKSAKIVCQRLLTMNNGNMTKTLHKRLFFLAIAAYLIIWAALFIFESRPFGVGSAIISSLLQAIPFIIALRMLIRWQTQRRREFVYLFILVIFVYGGVAYRIWDMYDKGQDRYYIEKSEFSEFYQLLHNDPAFRNVEITETPKEYLMTGTLSSEADLNRLKALTTRYPHLNIDERLKVTENAKQEKE
jgi:hypothetical protein